MSALKGVTWKKSLALLFAVAVLLGACASQQAEDGFSTMAENRSAGADAAAQEPAPYAFEGEAMDTFADEDFAAQEESSLSLQNDAQERLIIRTGNLTIVVEETEASMQNIANLAESLGGWVVNSNVYEFSTNNAEGKRGNMTIRVPAEQFDAVMAQIKGMAVEVNSEATSGQDVTEEYVDLASRLANLEATADRVRSFLDEADDVEDALAVNMELSRLEGEIEVIKGRMQYLSQSAAFSTISIDLTPDILSQPIEVGGWRPEGVVREAIEALVDTLQVLASAAIWLVIYLLPILLLLLIPLWLVVRFVARRRRNGLVAESAE